MNLYLDHFFAGIDAEDFDEYSILGELIQGTEVRTTSSGDMTWSGVYPRSSSGVYMELLQRSGDLSHAGLGLAFSGLGYESDVAETLRKLFPDVDWESNDVLLQGKEPWFRATKIRTSKQTSPAWAWAEKEEPRVWVWAMEYLGSRREERRQRIGQENTPIERFVSMEMRFPQDLYDGLNAKWLRWIPGTRNYAAEKFIVKIPCYESEDFTLIGTPDSRTDLPQVKKIIAKLKSGRSVEEYRGKSFKVGTSGNELTFELLK